MASSLPSLFIISAPKMECFFQLCHLFCVLPGCAFYDLRYSFLKTNNGVAE